MNSKFIASTVIALSALAGASAFAQTAPVHFFTEADVAIRPVLSSSNVTREQVRNDYLTARRNGEVAAGWEGFYVPAPVQASTATRAEVRNEAVTAAHMTSGNSAI